MTVIRASRSITSMTREHRERILALAIAADVDPRTARRAIEAGPTNVKGRVGERCARAMRELGISQMITPETEAA